MLADSIYLLLAIANNYHTHSAIFKLPTFAAVYKTKRFSATTVHCNSHTMLFQPLLAQRDGNTLLV